MQISLAYLPSDAVLTFGFFILALETYYLFDGKRVVIGGYIVQCITYVKFQLVRFSF